MVYYDYWINTEIISAVSIHLTILKTWNRSLNSFKNLKQSLQILSYSMTCLDKLTTALLQSHDLIPRHRHLTGFNFCWMRSIVFTPLSWRSFDLNKTSSAETSSLWFLVVHLVIKSSCSCWGCLWKKKDLYDKTFNQWRWRILLSYESFLICIIWTSAQVTLWGRGPLIDGCHYIRVLSSSLVPWFVSGISVPYKNGVLLNSVVFIYHQREEWYISSKTQKQSR